MRFQLKYHVYQLQCSVKYKKNKYHNMVTIASLVVLSFFAPSSLRIPLPLKIIRLI